MMYNFATITVRLDQNKHVAEAKILKEQERPEFLIGEIKEPSREYKKIYVNRFNSNKTRPIWVHLDSKTGYARQRVNSIMYVVSFPIPDNLNKILEFSVQLGYTFDKFIEITRE